MISSRSLWDLDPEARLRANRFLYSCAKAKIDVLVTCTYRDFECQSDLYAQGRTKPGKIVTNAKAGESWHNWKLAFDVVPLRHGRPVWGTTGNGIDDDPSDDERDDLELWQRLGALGVKAGLEWAGSWKSFREFPHFQFVPPGATLAGMLKQYPKGLV